MINKSSSDCEQDNHENKKYKNDSNDSNLISANTNDFINDVEMESANNGNGHVTNGKNTISHTYFQRQTILFSKFLGNLNNKNGFSDNNYVNTIDLDEEMGK